MDDEVRDLLILALLSLATDNQREQMCRFLETKIPTQAMDNFERGERRRISSAVDTAQSIVKYGLLP
jgi:hypothetical protein